MAQSHSQATSEQRRLAEQQLSQDIRSQDEGSKTFGGATAGTGFTQTGIKPGAAVAGVSAEQVVFSKGFERADERRNFNNGCVEIVRYGDGSSMGKATFKPGWRWKNDVAPIAKTEWCQCDHKGMCIKGSMRILMQNGVETVIREGEAYHIPAGHDGWVEGSEDCILVDMELEGEKYAKPASS